MNNTAKKLTGTALLAAGLCLTPAVASAQEVILGINLDGKKVLVELDGKKVKATIDGEDLPESQIETKGSVITVKDSEGNSVANIQRWSNGGNVYRIARSNKAAIGIELDTLSKGLADHLELDPNEVIYVTRAIKGRAAAKAGLRDHDVIVEIEGDSPVDEKKLFAVLGEKKPGDELDVRVLRRGKEQDITIRCERAKSNSNLVWGSSLNSPYFTQYSFPSSNYKSSLKKAMDALEKLNKTKIEKMSEKDYNSQLKTLEDALKKVQVRDDFHFRTNSLNFGDFDGAKYQGLLKNDAKVWNLGKGKKGKKGISFIDPKNVIYGVLDDTGNVVKKDFNTIGELVDKSHGDDDTAGMSKKLDKLEKQFDRLEKLLENLLDKKKNNN